MIPPRFVTALASRYRLEGELGAGGMATVFLAEDVRHHRMVAVKVLRPELSAALGTERFLREIELTAHLQHPHILPLFDSGEAEGLLYYVMPFVDGETLRDRLDREGKLGVASALSIAGDVASALMWAHDRGVVHRDVKPANILLSGDEALVADFGIALALAKVDEDRLTGTGLSVGTPAYMSPEQIAGDRNADGRSDQYALACVLFEMLVGEPPFTGPTPQSALARTLVEKPRRARELRPDTPPSTDAAIARALAKDPAARFATVKEFSGAFAPPAPALASAPNRRRHALAAVGVVALVSAVGWPLWSNAEEMRARAALPDLAALAADGRYVEAYTQATPLEGRLGADSTFVAIMHEVSDLLTVITEPVGARVFLHRLPALDEPSGDSVAVGRTPLADLLIPRVDHRVSVHLDGRLSAERIASSGLGRSVTPSEEGRTITLRIALPEAGSIPADMVPVPGGPYTLVGPDLPLGLESELRPFLIDRYEVTNAQYREFVRGGGYTNDDLWPTTPPGASDRFVDRTGLAGPREWRNQEPPADLDTHPVTGVSWHEGSAYCRARGRRLPTLFEWEKAARDGQVSHRGVVMPWGYVSAVRETPRRANFSGRSTAPVDEFPFGLSPYGVHGLAGNAKEWLANQAGDGFVVAGGSWQDPAYVFSVVGTLPGATASPAIGFRCARDAAPGEGDQGAGRLDLSAAPPVYRPVDEDGFRSLLAFYNYDRRPADARLADVQETPDWRKERLWLNGVGGDSILAYLYVPTHAAPPYQTIVFVPSSASFFFAPVWKEIESALGVHIKAGRAVFAVVFDGMLERPLPAGTGQPASHTVGFRDQMVRHATQLRMGIDYLETRAEIDTERLAYFGSSWGSGSRLVFAAVDDRYRAVVLLGAGIDERVQPTLPEAANFNFAPYIRQPKLMLNGRQDEEHPWMTRAKPLWDILREPKELVFIEGAGHHPPLELRAAPINDFLDRTLGPVRWRSGTPP